MILPTPRLEVGLAQFVGLALRLDLEEGQILSGLRSC